MSPSPLRRSAVLAAALAVIACAVGGCGGSAGDARPATGTTTAPRPATTVVQPSPPPDPALALSTGQLVGQRLLTGYDGATPTRSVLRAVRRGTVGGVILFADNVPTAAAARHAAAALQRAARRGRQPYLLVLIDQEGGQVRRLGASPPAASAAEMGAADRSGAAAERQGERTGRALRRRGINVDLAPVADVPRADDSFLGSRAFGRRPSTVARAACGFAAGLARAGVAATLKHFPGLGRATANTDEEPVTIGADRAALTADVQAYRRCGGDVPLAMIASAVYPALDRTAPAVLSPATYDVLAATGFRGLTISDAFDTPAIVAHDRPARRALRAGLDLLLFGQDEAGARQTHRRLVADVRAERIDRTALRATASRILAFKERLRQAMDPAAR